MAEKSSDSQMESHTVFIDTNLDTHLVMIVTDQDTVGDFKEKVLIEHPRCFPSIGEITIHSLKLMRKGRFYHLPNSMLVKSAFNGIKNNWFVHMDVASIRVEPTKKTLSLDDGVSIQPEFICLKNGPSAEVGRADDHLSREVFSLYNSSLPQIGTSDLVNKLVPLVSPENVDGGIANDENLGGKCLTNEDKKASFRDDVKRLDSPLPMKQDLVCEASKVLETNTKCKKKKSKKRTKDIQCDDILISDPHLEPIAKKPCLSEKKREDSLCNSVKAPLEEHDSGICMSGGDMTNPENLFHDNSLPGKSISSANLDGLSNKVLVDDHSSSYSLVSGETKRKLSIHRENGNSTCNSFRKNCGQENSREESRNNHEELSKESDATIPLRKDPTVVLEKNIRITPVKGTAEGSSIPSSISHPQDVDSPQDVDMGGVGGGRLEGSIDASDKTLTDQGRKAKNGTEVLLAPRKKKTKKTKASNSKSNVSTSGVNHVEGFRDVEHDVFVSDKAFGQDNTGIKTMKGDDVFSKSEGLKASDLKTVTTPIMGLNKKDQGNEPEGDSLQLSQVEWVQETQDNIDEETSIKGVDVPSKSYSTPAAVEIQDARDQRKKKSNRSKASDVKSNVSISGVEHVEGVGDASQLISESDRAFVQDSPVIRTKKLDNDVSQPERRKASKQKTKSPPVVGYDNKDYQGDGNEEDPLQLAHVSGVRETTDNIDSKIKAGLVKVPASSSDTTLDLGTKERVVTTTDPSLSIKVNKEEAKATSKKRRKSKAQKDSSLSKILPEAENGSGLRTDPLEQHQLSGTVGSPEFKSNPVVAGPNPVNGATDGANDYLPVPKSDVDQVNFRDYFVHENGNHEAVVPEKEPAEKEVQIRKREKELKVNKKAKKHHTHLADTASGFEKSHGSIDNQGCRTTQRGTSEIASITAGERVEKSLDDHDKLETNKFSRNKSVFSSEDTNSLSAVPLQSPSGVNTHTSPKVNSVAVEKLYRKPVLNNFDNQKSVTTSTKVSSESSTESSEDKYGGGKSNSDASTKSPSDTSSSSDHSDGESEVNLKSPRSGYGNKITKSTGHRNSKSKEDFKIFIARTGMGLDTVLRSSRSYKKAKLTASQSQPEDFESQPIPFNLDSQA
ncbi:Cop1-interacting protein [Thalictrum thalictroides]|uniref:Cop1-interacting protein n=1 Tax=Thalictrum thalictroides TaxID=46969 RepID=A0A7J6WZ84_THATH|nr:Cop1-interacting protein [Thalictrum thalictroides]